MNNNQQNDNVLHIPVEPVSLPCSECGGENYPNYRYELVGMSGVLCKPCLSKELATINAVLQNEQSQEPWDTDLLEAVKKDTSPMVPSRCIKKYVQITEHNSVMKSMNTQVEYESDNLPEWFKPLQPIIEDETFSSMHISLGKDVHYFITATPY